MKEYRHITIAPGTQIGEAFSILQNYKNHNVDACTEFNGTTITTDMSLDELYKSITGKTIDEWEKYKKERREKEEAEREERKKHNSEIISYWVNEGKNFVTKNIDEWEECVKARVDDLYNGAELRCLSEVAHNIDSKNFEEAKNTIEEQNHSGWSYNLMMSLIYTFLAQGEAYLKYIGII